MALLLTHFRLATALLMRLEAASLNSQKANLSYAETGECAEFVDLSCYPVHRLLVRPSRSKRRFLPSCCCLTKGSEASRASDRRPTLVALRKNPSCIRVWKSASPHYLPHDDDDDESEHCSKQYERPHLYGKETTVCRVACPDEAKIANNSGAPSSQALVCRRRPCL